MDRSISGSSGELSSRSATDRLPARLLRETGLVINHKAVLRIMRKYNLLAIRKRKRFRHYDCNTYTHYNNELMRNFKATKPNEKWVTDISYIQTKQGFLYLSMIKDLYDNSIVGYKYATQMPASLVIETVRAAVKNAKPSTSRGTEGELEVSLRASIAC